MGLSFHSGAYAPLTSEGNLIVDGILASSYASVEHNLSHVGMKPLQWFPKEMQWIFGKEDEQISYITSTNDLGKLILSHRHFWQN